MRTPHLMKGVTAAGLTLWAALPLSGQSRLSVLFGFDQAPDAAVVEWMERETAALFSEAGVAFSWQEEDRSNDLGATDLVVWVRFHGDCRASSGSLSLPTDGALGWTESQDGDIQPLIDVDCDRAAALVWRNRGTVPMPLTTRAFGRALGRILAHELYHYLTGSAVHGASELFSRTMHPGFLLSEKVRFENSEITALREGLKVRAGGGER